MGKSRKNRWSTSTRRTVWWCLALLNALLVAAMLLAPSTPEPTEVPLSEAVAHIRAGEVLKAQVDDGAHTVTLTLSEDGTGTGRGDAVGSSPGAHRRPWETGDTPGPDARHAGASGVARAGAAASRGREVSFEAGAKPEGPQVVADFPASYAEALTELLLDEDVPTDTTPVDRGNVWTQLLFSLLPILIIAGLLIYFMRSYGGGIGKLGKRGEAVGDVPAARFSDVAGCDEALGELQELVEFLADGSRFTRTGAKPPRGALLVGPPGTGKTLLARAVAGEAGVPFFALAGSDFVETFVGVGAKRVRDLFEKARKAPGAIIFIDEIDAVGRTRGSGPQQGGDSERENTLISMLNEMDGFDDEHRIIVLAATNRADVLDPALVRPGRLDRQIQVPAPDRRGREAILRVHARGKPVADDVDFLSLARRTPGMAGAELEQLVNEACMEAARAGDATVGQGCFDAAIATVALGRARTSALVTEHDRRITAWHEAGHTVAALVQEHADDPVSVSIVPRGPAGGVTWMSGSDDVYLTRDKALAQLRVALAGRAAEEVLLGGGYTQGAHGDLTSASNLAWSMVTKYAMSEAGYLVIPDEAITMGGPVAERARAVAEELLADAHADATRLMAAHADLLAALAEALLDRETLSRAEIADLAAAHPAPQG